MEVTDASDRSLAGASRFSVREHRTPAPLVEADAFVDAIVELCRNRRIDLLLPVTDASLSALLSAGDRLGSTRLPFPDEETYHALSDKRQLMDRAAALGIRVPRTAVVESRSDLEDELDLHPAPWVCKPFRSVVGEGASRSKVGVRHARTRSELLETLHSYPREAFPVLVQEYVEGRGEGVFLLVWEGERLAAFRHRRIREKPPTGGVSVYRESAAPDPELIELATRLLTSSDWRGVAMVEFRRSGATGDAYLMEINGRFWGSLQLAIDAGVDFPHLLAALAMGEAIEANPDWRRRIRSRWLLGDLDHLLLRMKGSYRPEELPLGSPPTRLWALLHFIRIWWPGDRFEILRPSDPGPWFRELRHWIRGLAI